MKSTTITQSHFANIENPKIQRSKFDRSSGWKGDFDAGQLIPFFIDEALPGDTFQGNVNIFGRLSTPLKPIMDNIYIDVHFFSVPNRLVWDNWKRFMGERPDPDSTTDFLIPELNLGVSNFPPYSNPDYLGLPTSVTGLTNISALPFRAIQLTWNEWYRDQNLQDSLTFSTGDGPDLITNYLSLLPRGKRKDYFTSAFTSPQKGPPVEVPIGSTADLTIANNSSIITNSLTPRFTYGAPADFQNQTLQAFKDPATTSRVDLFSGRVFTAAETVGVNAEAQFGNQSGLKIDLNNVKVDLSTATATTINQLRQAFQLQRMYERDQRGGTRYTELVRSHFGVISPDARQQRPEFLGGGTLNVNVNPIAQTSATLDDSTPQGNLSAMGTFSTKGHIRFTKSFTEHEIIIGFLSARADLNYQQGINKMWLRQTRDDFYWPTYAHLGEQAILNKELYAQGTSADEEVFGYQERYSEYRYKPGIITGAFRSNYAQSLDIWHLAQDFATLPALNGGFIQEQPPMGRIVAVPSEKTFLADIFTELHCTRPMPTYSTPGLIDHF